ncbi:MAG: amidotransferase [Spirochaetes bacterium GWF1_51_8]|nr:MAG: amidotransferase [Spirochaetes bacterium GWF1_51_8]
MKIHYIQHVDFEDPANILKWAAARGHSLSSTKIFEKAEFPSQDSFDWLVIMGGPMSTYEEEIYPWLRTEKAFIRDCISDGKTVIGICLGAQMLADVLGGKVFPNKEKEIGWFPIDWTVEARVSPYFQGMPLKPVVYHWHGDTFTAPDWTIRIASSEATFNQGFIAEDGKSLVIALQFHLESTPESVDRIIANAGREIKPAAHIQTAPEMSSRGTDFRNIEEMIFRLMDNIYAERKQ